MIDSSPLTSGESLPDVDAPIARTDPSEIDDATTTKPDASSPARRREKNRDRPPDDDDEEKRRDERDEDQDEEKKRDERELVTTLLLLPPNIVWGTFENDVAQQRPRAKGEGRGGEILMIPLS